jgi:hypothetical protein
MVSVFWTLQRIDVFSPAASVLAAAVMLAAVAARFFATENGKDAPPHGWIFPTGSQKLF